MAVNARRPADDGAQRTEVATFLRTIHPSGHCFEVRALECPERAGSEFRTTCSGYFDAIDTATDAVLALDVLEPAATYCTLNPVEPALLARAANRVKPKAKATTADSDVARRCWFVVDIDPKRPAGISSTDEEMRAAVELAHHIAVDRRTDGWPEPVICMSGNGAYLLYRIDLPNDDASKTLVSDVLKRLALTYNTPAAEIDLSTFNAARIVKVIGTHARKGDDVLDRPHRRSALLERPAALVPVSGEQLRAFAPPAAPRPATPPGSSSTRPTRTFDRVGNTPGDVRAYLERHGVQVVREEQDGAYTQLVLEHCPITGAEGGTGTSVTVRIDGSGKITYHNKHNRAIGSAESWAALREYLEPGYQAWVSGWQQNPSSSKRDLRLVPSPTPIDEATTRHAEGGKPSSPPDVRTLRDGLAALVTELPSQHGRRYLGLQTGPRFQTIDDNLCGFRGLLVAAAAPGIGKTTLGLNFGLATVQFNPERVVFVFFSFEMSARAMKLRLLSHATGLSWRRLVLGEFAQAADDRGLRFNRDDRARFDVGLEALEELQDQIVILDSGSVGLTGLGMRPADWFISHIDAAKVATGAERAFVLIDSLQTIPITTDATGQPWREKLEAERYTIAQLLAVQRHAEADPVFVISEQAKSALGRSDMVSVLGTGRGIYSPDCVITLVTDPDANASRDRIPATTTEVDLVIQKGRDGMRRATVPLTFHHETSRFEEAHRQPIAGRDMARSARSGR